MIAAMLRGARKDVKILANHLLSRLPPLRDVLLFVDPFGNKSSGGERRGLRQAVRFVRAGGMLAMFPAGEVAHFDWASGQVVDAPWNEALAHLVKASGAPVLPIHFRGHNGPLFHLAGLVHPRLRTALLPRELLNKRGTQIEVRVGAVVSPRKLASFASRSDIVAYLRGRTAMLAERNEKATRTAPVRESPWPLRPVVQPIGHAVDPDILVREIDALPEAQILVREKERVVCLGARAADPDDLRRNRPATRAHLSRGRRRDRQVHRSRRVRSNLPPPVRVRSA